MDTIMMEDNVFDLIRKSKSYVIRFCGLEVDLRDLGVNSIDLVRQLEAELDVYNNSGVKILERIETCWCCGRIRYRFAMDIEQICPTFCMCKRIATKCRYSETKECKSDGNCKGQDSFA